MKLYFLNKIVLSFRNNAEKLLTGITSNTLDQPRNAFVNVHGRVIATFDQLKTGADEFLIVIDSFAREALSAHIQKFLMLNKTEAKEKGLKVYWDLDGSYKVQEGEHAIPQRSGRLVLSPKTLDANVSDEEFTLFRLKNNIPLFGVDYKPEEFLLNVDEDEFVSYTKGCFLGQEPIAKVHNRSKPTWKLSVRFEDELTDAEKAKMTSKAKDPATGRVQGFILVSNRSLNTT